ncbi:MAG: hypothetical protein ACK4Z0_03335 [Sphingomonadaceae bacterium]
MRPAPFAPGRPRRAGPGLAALLFAAAAPAAAGEGPGAGDADLALQLSNPVASLISVPIQQNFDFGLGANGRGWTSRTNIQPVVPFRLNDDWSLISRTILPIVAQDGVTAPGASQFGLGDTVQSLFRSPRRAGSLIWGAGPVFLLPTGTDRALGTGKWGIGPTGVVLSQSASGVTVGMLANHIWSFAGASSRPDVSATLLQPFATLTTRQATTFGFNIEAAHDWKRDQWIIPANLTIAQLVKLGRQPAQVGGGVRYYLGSPRGGPDWGVRLSLTLLFPAG